MLHFDFGFPAPGFSVTLAGSVSFTVRTGAGAWTFTAKGGDGGLLLSEIDPYPRHRQSPRTPRGAVGRGCEFHSRRCFLPFGDRGFARRHLSGQISQFDRDLPVVAALADRRKLSTALFPPCSTTREFGSVFQFEGSNDR